MYKDNSLFAASRSKIAEVRKMQQFLEMEKQSR
jgi:hypothetical protein